MKKLTIMLVTIFLVLSGCVNRAETAVKTNGGNSENKNIIDGTITDNIGVGVKVDKDSTEDIIVESEWCNPGDKITVQTSKGREEFTIKGVTNYQGREVCQAEQIYDNGKKIRYFSKDGKFISEIANSSGSGSVGVYSEVSVIKNEIRN